MVTVTGGIFRVTELSALVDAELLFAASSVTAPARIEARTVPDVRILPIATLYVVPLPVILTVAAETSALDPARDMLEPVKPVTDWLKTAVKLMGAEVVGSAWAPAWSIVTVGP